MTRHLAQASGLVDCGTLLLRPMLPAQAYLDAQRCILEAVTRAKPFRLIQQVQGIDSSVMHGYLWDGASASMLALDYDGDPSGGSDAGAVVMAAPCAAFVAQEGCTPSRDELCLTCSAWHEAYEECRNAPGGANGA